MTAAPPGSTVERVRAAEVANVYANVVVGVLGGGAAAVALALSLLRLGASTPGIGALWASSIVACAGIHIALRVLYARAPHRNRDWRWWGNWFTLLCLAEGLGWGWGSIYLLPEDRFDAQVVIFAVCFGLVAGAVPAYGCYLPAFFAIFFGTLVPKAVWAVVVGSATPEGSLFISFLVIVTFTMAALALRANRSFRAMVHLQINTEALAEDLRRQKEIAEQANRAKSTFLAAASHDLRQPVHALGLFVGALRGFGLPAPAQRLVEQIETATVALDGLFSAILDLSRLDAGVVDVRPRAFAIGPLLERICRDHAAEAEARGVPITLLPCGGRVLTDPALLERIMRNLVGNAVRYTRQGRILVGGRRRGGTLRIEVWDTGPGIPPDRQDWIFQEYSQLDNAERDRSKGLGLGLAIVRRLSALLGCPISLRSAPGRGSCFSVSVPLTHAAAEAAAPWEEATPRVARRWLILVVDDEKPIREAMATLLTGWGHTVITAASGDDMLADLATCPDKPDLIVCDYRLRGEENGIDVVERLRSEYNETIPAMLITGDTAPERLAEARRSGLLLLHKPVPNAKLRAAMTHLVAAAEAEAAEAEAEEGAADGGLSALAGG